MGLFASRPEEPEEWAGLPSEPLDRSHETDLDAEAPAADALTLGLGSSLDSIEIPVPPAAPSVDGAERTDG
jgi:hypothetical protein